MQELPSDAGDAPPFVLIRMLFNFQIALSIMVNPPKPGDESHEQYWQERNAEIASLRRRAHMVTDGFNALEGVTCNFTEGAMYSFPRVSGWLQGCCSALGQEGKQKGVVVAGGWPADQMEGSAAGSGGCYGAVMQASFSHRQLKQKDPAERGLVLCSNFRTMHLVLVVAQLCASALLWVTCGARLPTYPSRAPTFLCPSDPPAPQGSRGRPEAGQGSRCVLLPEAAGGHWH